MLHLLATTAAFGATWSYGYYKNDDCTKIGDSITLDGKKKQEATGIAIGGCITSEYGNQKWSMKLKSCKADGDGRLTEVIEYACEDCDCAGAALDTSTYKTGVCTDKIDGSYRKLTIDGECEDPCFPSKAMVMKADGTPARVDALVEGDEIVATADDGSLTTDTVSLLSIRQPEAKAQFLVLVTASNATLTLTPEHHLPVGASCCSTLKKAKDVKIGDKAWAIKDGAPVQTTVTAISKMPGEGLHSPVLTHGRFPVVDGLVTSFDSIDKVHLAKYGLAPLIAACKRTGTCAKLRELFHAADGKYVPLAGSEKVA